MESLGLTAEVLNSISIIIVVVTVVFHIIAYH